MKVSPKSALELPPVAKAHPFLRWAGSKRQLLPKLKPLIEASTGRYIEPFMGSAALFFSLASRKGILSDLNGELVETFLTVRSSPRAVADDAALECLRSIPFLNLGLLESISAAVEIVGLHSKQRDLKWGLLFDELEIAPPHIRTTLVRAVRSTDQRLLLKLSISPYSGEIDRL